jgi:hypothetical protein
VEEIGLGDTCADSSCGSACPFEYGICTDSYCNTVGDEPFVCTEYIADDDPCPNNGMGCNPATARCGFPQGGEETPTCIPLIGAGEPCSSTAACVPGYSCFGTCPGTDEQCFGGSSCGETVCNATCVQEDEVPTQCIPQR